MGKRFSFAQSQKLIGFRPIASQHVILEQTNRKLYNHTPSKVNHKYMTVNESSKADVILQGDHIKRAEHLLGVANQQSEIIYDPERDITIITVNVDIAEQVSQTLSDSELEVAGILSFQPKAAHQREDCLGESSCASPSSLQAEFSHMIVRCCEADECQEIAGNRAVSQGLRSMAS